MQTIGSTARFFRHWLPYLVPAVLLAALFPGPAGGVAAAFAQTFQTGAPHAILIDSASSSVLFEKDADALVVPASTVKIMTAEMVFHEIALGHLKLDDQFVVSETAWRYGGAPARGSAMFAAPNSQIRVEDLIRGLVIDSGNDAAIALAEGIAGSEGAFATLMTKRARELGLEHSTFTNAWGRGDPDQKVSPREMAALANHVILTYPDLYKYFGEKDFTWNKIKQANR
ncbi:MAG: D-alanyl-D-alanine carboxypeptidase family protein, partial [Methylocella sp.]